MVARPFAALALAVAVVATGGVSLDTGHAGAAPRSVGAQWVRAAVPAMEAYWQDHRTYVGATVKGLRRTYDRSLKNVRIVRTAKSAYCMESTAGSPPAFVNGPAHPVATGRCSRSTPSAPRAVATNARLSFQSLPKRVVQGETARVAVNVRQDGARCSLDVRYLDGNRQPNLSPQQAVGGRASWSWQVPLTVQAGPAKVTASCAGAGSLTRTIVIVGAKTPGHIDVVKSGFSVRVRSYGGSSVSWGLLLANSSKTSDALDALVLVNMVDAGDHAIGTATQRVAIVPAGDKSFAVGSSLAFPGAAPVVRLEVVVQVGSWAKKLSKMPAVDNIGIAESTYDRGWVGQVQGELVNDDEVQTLSRATLDAVVLDADGNIIGGGQGYSVAPLPSGTRQVFTIKTGVDAIPFPKAVSALVSSQPQYAAPGA